VNIKILSKEAPLTRVAADHVAPTGAAVRATPTAWLIAATVAACALIGVHAVSGDGVVRELSYLAVLIGASGAAWLGARRNPTDEIAQLLALSISISALADVTWQSLAWSRGVGPDVSVADILWFASYVAIGGALLRTLRGHGRIDRDGMVDIAVVFLVALLVQWDLAFDKIVTDATLPVFERFVVAMYPTLDAALLALVVRAALSRRLHERLALLVGAGTVCWLLADFGYTLFASVGTLEVWMNMGWMLGSLLLAAATWCHRSTSVSAADAAAALAEGSRPSGIAIALVPLLVPGAIAVIHQVRGESSNSYLLYVVTVMLLGLAFTRGTRILRAEETARAAVRSQERYARAVAMNSADAFVVLDERGRILNEAPQLAALLGLDGSTTVGEEASNLVAMIDQDDALAVFDRCLSTPAQTFETELRVQHAQGHELWLNARLINLSDDPDVGGAVVNLHDISDRKRAEAELSHQAFHDGLTDLANRALFINRVEHALHRNLRTGLDVAVIFLDLDGFKTVNDSLGHAAGDQLLKEVATRLGDSVRAGDTVARLGGDEFAILIEQSPNPLEESEGVSERILQALASPIELDGQTVTVSASFGIAAGDIDSTATSLLRDADVAMYRAKTAGKSRWVIYDPEMRTAAVERLQLENDLIGALAAGQFALLYQPVVQLETEQVVGFEALLRWHHPDLGTVEPDRFIPIAEETGLIIPIGRWVLHEACRTVARWHRDHPQHHRLSMAVNVSARQLACPDLVDDVRSSLADTGIDPSTLVLEMTETSLIRDTTVAARRLEQLSALGVRLAIDDFGTGYSSLSYLRQFPFDILKIDRSFISTITDRTQVPAIVRGLLDLGHTLELETIAEGVELGVQRDQLRGENCDLAQGYLFSRPLAESDAEQLLRELTPRTPAPTAS
jgi:diguanylate cyclase (GGDEF)-like protein/PAS domain S-box-containing protein